VRIAALDVGEVRIGLAICDELEMTANPVATIRRVGNLEKDITAVATQLAQQQAEMVVVGLPLSLGGDKGPQALRVEGFAKALAKRSGLPLVYWDESLTSVEADEMMIRQGVSRARRREQIDRVAAALILSSYLDSRREGRGPAAAGEERA